MGDSCPTSSSDATHSTLPIELCYLVIDFVAVAQCEREATLAACALVCRAWLSIARPHIFHTIALRSFREYDRFSDSLQSGARIASHVRVLHFKIRSMSLGTSDHNRTLPISLFTQLPALESINYYSSLTAQTSQLRMELGRLPRVPSVTSFSIHICVFRKFSDMVLLLSAFPNLRKLRLFEVIFVEHDAPYPHHAQFSSLPLRSLHLESLKEARPVFAWLVSTCSISGLRNLSVGLDVEGSLAILSQFLRICGGSVKHLSIRTRAGAPIKSRHGTSSPQLVAHGSSYRLHRRSTPRRQFLPTQYIIPYPVYDGNTQLSPAFGHSDIIFPFEDHRQAGPAINSRRYSQDCANVRPTSRRLCNFRSPPVVRSLHESPVHRLRRPAAPSTSAGPLVGSVHASVDCSQTALPMTCSRVSHIAVSPMHFPCLFLHLIYVR